MLPLSYELLNEIANQYGQSFYIIDEEKFELNFNELRNAFRKIYPKMNIGYSHKTNYTPSLCHVINRLGGYAEVVSDMEYQVAKRVGFDDSRIIFNGPCKNKAVAEAMLLHQGHVNLDSETEFLSFVEFVKEHPQQKIGIGLRCNFDTQDGILSRFGIDTESKLFADVLTYIQATDNVYLRNLHCHFAHRSLACWTNRAKNMLALIDKYHLNSIEQIDLGGGLFGKMPESFKQQFDEEMPSYSEYAQAIAPLFAERYGALPAEEQPELVIEPGNSLAGDVMSLAAKVLDIKQVRGKSIATLLATFYNINPTLVFMLLDEQKHIPMRVIAKDSRHSTVYEDLDFGGFTCIEFDYLYKHYKGPLAVGDYVVFDNVGAYSIVLKPPFILPNFAVVSVTKNGIKEIKRAETFEDVFQTFRFEF